MGCSTNRISGQWYQSAEWGNAVRLNEIQGSKARGTHMGPLRKLVSHHFVLAASVLFRSDVYFHHGLAGSPAMNRTAAMNTSIMHGS